MSLSFTDVLESLTRLGVRVDPRRVPLTPAEPTDDTQCESMVRGLVAQGALTAYQAEALLSPSATDPILLSDYVLLDRIGGGGMGVVFKARHRAMDRIVALKMLRPGLLADAAAEERFQRECRAAAKLNHPNIVAAFDAGCDQRRHFLVMEFLKGHNLSEVVRRDGPLPLAAALDCITQTARGLQHMHAQGVVHRDIKPSNLMQTPAGIVKILDVGLARLAPSEFSMPGNAETISRLTGSGHIFGTADFMAPEQAFDTATADHRADIYSLGCTLYFLLSGRVVYPAGSSLEALIAHRDQPIPSVAATWPAGSDAVERVFRRMLQKDPAGRYPDMEALLRDLEACQRELEAHRVASETVASKTVAMSSQSSRIEPVGGRARSTAGARAAGAGALLAALAALAAWFARNHGDAQGPPPLRTPTSSVAQHVHGNGLSPPPPDRAPRLDPDAIVDADRGACAWVLTSKGRLTVNEGGNEVVLKPGDPVPQAPFHVVSIELPFQTVVTEQNLKSLSRLRRLQRLQLKGAVFPPGGWATLGALSELRSLDLFSTQAGDADLEFVARLTRLEELRLGYTHLTDAGLEHVRPLRELTELRLTRTAVTDAGLDRLAGLSKLKSLHLDQTRIAGSGFEVMLQFRDLETLVLGGTQVNDATLKPLALCRKLRTLVLSETRISDAGLESVGKIPTLTSLWLERTAVTSAGLANLAGLSELAYLELSETKVDDAGLERLVGLTMLRTIKARRSEVTAAGAAALKDRLPQCSIIAE